MIKITIPLELKSMWQNEKHLLEELENGKNGFLFKGNTKKIDSALKINDVLFILERIDALTSYSRYGYIENKGFFKEYKEWLDFSLKEILKVKKINIKNDNDIYLILGIVNKVLNDFSNYDFFSTRELVNNYVYKIKDGFDIDHRTKEMCNLFIDIGFGIVKPIIIANISYENYINHKEEEKIKKNRK